ncbi:uncharacterized protein [Chiloscyllium punctatum]|uniref:uncharacterized protein isoform X1 n=1 Tax=Chiloscyllium punctatum TaxID=137246 RepID=UPI003B63B5F7
MVMMPSGLPPRFAPSPPKAELKRREKAFLLDCVAISSIARDYSYSAPKAGTVIPPYNAQNDRHALAYFRTKPLPPLLRKTGQSRGGTSIHGVTVDRFQFQGAAAGYLRTRNKNGAECQQCGVTCPNNPGHTCSLCHRCRHQISLPGISPRKTRGPDAVPSHACRSCVDQLAEVFIDIFNLTLLQVKVPTCFKQTTIIPVPKKAHAMCVNDYRPVALTILIMKCFERLVMAHINSSLPACLDPLQFVQR